MHLTPHPAVLAALAALCLSSGALAQDRPAGAPMDPSRRGEDHGAWRKAHEERRARFLRDVLNLRPDQEAAFQAFQAQMMPEPHDHKDWAEHHDDASTPMTTPERLDRMAAFMTKHTAERQAAFQRRADAVKRFYAVLGPEQQRAFDALGRMHDMGMGHHGDHPGGGEGQPGEGDGAGRHHGQPG